MAIASGIGSQLGIAAEATYGTYVAPTRFLEPSKASAQKVKNTIQSTGLAAGRLMNLGARRVVTTKAGKGQVSVDVLDRGFGMLFQSLMGSTVTPVQQGATTAYLQTHTLADTFGKSLTVQLGIPNTAGTVTPYTLLGAKVPSAQFTFEVDKPVQSQWDLDAKDITESQTLVAASYSTDSRPFVGTDTSVKVGAFGSEAAVTGVKKATVKIDRGLKTDRFYFGAQGLKAEPIVGDFAKITGTISADFVDKTIWADRFAADASFSLVLESVGLLIAGTYFATLRITLPQCFLDGDTPTVDGPDIVSGDFPFTATFDGTNLPKIEYISVDAVV